jgi:Pvc16 N-terminal domain
VIDKALTVLAGQLNAFLNARFGGDVTEQAALGPVPDQSKDTIPAHPLTLSLVRIEEERVVKTQTATRKRDGQVEDIPPDIKLNLFVMVVAHGTNYANTLKFLSATVAFFQSRPVFDHANCPGLDESIEKLLVELHTQTFEEQNQLWGSLSLRYLPSVLYRVRMLIIQEGALQRTAPGIRALDMVGAKV